MLSIALVIAVHPRCGIAFATVVILALTCQTQASNPFPIAVVAQRTSLDQPALRARAIYNVFCHCWIRLTKHEMKRNVDLKT